MSARSTKRGWRGAILLALAFGLFGSPGPAHATFKYGPIEISGDVSTQWWVRHSTFNDLQFVQNRNTARLQVQWELVEKGKLLDRVDVPFIKRSSLFILYRGVYDSFYDIAPGGNQKGIHRFDDVVGGPISGNEIGTCVGANGATNDCPFNVDPTAEAPLRGGLYSRFTSKNREDKQWENVLREAYIDLRLKDAPVSFRLGRQQVIWGESDVFRMMDIWNPLDLTWHLQQENWDKLRKPLWLAKGIWDTGRLGPFSNTFVEAVWNPGDYAPGVMVDWLPNPWAVPINDPTRPGQIQMPGLTTGIFLTPIFDLNGTNFRQGDFHRNPIEASDFGIRFHGVTQQGIEFTTNYIYARGRGTGMKAGAPFALRIDSIAVNEPIINNSTIVGRFSGEPVFPVYVKGEIVHPYTHIFGLTGNYFDGTFTNTVFRMETTYQLSVPFQTNDLDDRVQSVACTDPENLIGCGEDPNPQISPVGFTKRDLWSGMIGFDRPTWIKWLNNKTTWFLTGQFFWSYVVGAHSSLRGGVVSAAEAPYRTPEIDPRFLVNGSELIDSQGVGQWGSGPYAGQVERTQNQDLSNGAIEGLADNIRQWEMLATFAATSFYKGGTVVPFIGMGFDLVNGSYLAQLKLNYFFTNNLVMELRQNYYMRMGGGTGPRLDPWGAGGLLARRDETGVRLTYQF